ncbi:MAG: spore coat protein CotJB [Clostridia bacterium]|nr:spore coat protein CotJB [Clostridia bacterium]
MNRDRRNNMPQNMQNPNEDYGENMHGAGNEYERAPSRIAAERYENMASAALLEEIRALSFVKVELELFLDTHPNSQKALDYYQQTIDALDMLYEIYHEKYGPLLASGVTDPDKWTWVNTPWPWQVGNGAPEKGGRG